MLPKASYSFLTFAAFIFALIESALSYFYFRSDLLFESVLDNYLEFFFYFESNWLVLWELLSLLLCALIVDVDLPVKSSRVLGMGVSLNVFVFYVAA